MAQDVTFGYDPAFNTINTLFCGQAAPAGAGRFDIVGADSPSGDNDGTTLTITGGRSFGIGTGGQVGLAGGPSLTTTGSGGFVVIEGGAGFDAPGGVSISAGNAFGGATTAGANVSLVGSNGSGPNQDGGNVQFFPGLRTGSGVPGRIVVGVLGSSYALANSTNAVLVTAVGPVGLISSTINHWLPITVDGTTYFMPLWK